MFGLTTSQFNTAFWSMILEARDGTGRSKWRVALFVCVFIQKSTEKLETLGHSIKSLGNSIILRNSQPGSEQHVNATQGFLLRYMWPRSGSLKSLEIFFWGLAAPATLTWEGASSFHSLIPEGTSLTHLNWLFLQRILIFGRGYNQKKVSKWPLRPSCLIRSRPRHNPKRWPF